jgi:RecA/RadA recombinase
MGKNFFDDLVKETGNEYASVVDDGVTAGDVSEYIDTGSYALNALLSGSIYGGLPSNKITAFAGESATGKTFFVLGIVKNFLDTHETGGVIYFESESALTKDMIVGRGIDAKRMHIVPVSTIQEFSHQVTKIVAKYTEQPEEKRLPLLLCLDSLGMLSTTKEVAGITEGSETKDMTRAALIRGAFRVLTLKLGAAKIPMIITNHTYATMSLYSTQEIGGGGGLKFAASSILTLSRKQEKDGDEVVGSIIHCKTYKSRLTREKKLVDVLLRHDAGLNRYYGLLPVAEKHGVVKKISTKYKFPDGTEAQEGRIKNKPEKYFTEDVLKKIDEACKKEFLYGSGSVDEAEEEL